MIEFQSKGSFQKTDEWFSRMSKADIFDVLDGYAVQGMHALANATPTDSGVTAESWTYEVVKKRGRYAIIFHNTHMVSGRPIAILIQYGHGTGTGGYVEGRDYINPVILPLFNKIANDVWKAVTK